MTTATQNRVVYLRPDSVTYSGSERLIDEIGCGVKEHTQRIEINLRALTQADLQMITFSEMMMTIIMIMTMMNLK